MWSSRLTRQIALATGAAALVGMGALTACSKEDKEKPEETKSPTSSARRLPATQPTEKNV